MYSVLSLLAALAFLLPCLKQLDDGVLHLQGRIGFWKILAYAFPVKGQTELLRLLFLGHDCQHTVLIEPPGLAEFLHPLGLGE